MKKKILILSVIALAVIICSGTILYASNNLNSFLGKILNKKTVDFFEEAYVEKKVEIDELSVDKLIEKSNEMLIKLGINDKKIDINNSKIIQYENEIDSRNEILISNDDFSIKLNSDNGEILAFTSNKTSFELNNMNEDEIEKLAQKIFDELEIEESEKYVMDYVIEFDEEIYRAGFVKKYEELINPEENVKFSFAPQTKEIVTLGINCVPYDNNEILIDEYKAQEIARQYLLKSKRDAMTMEIQIIRPNYFYEEKLEYGKVYKKNNHCRKAYVFTFNNEDKTKVYIDCTTGEVLGGDIIKGSEF